MLLAAVSMPFWWMAPLARAESGEGKAVEQPAAKEKAETAAPAAGETSASDVLKALCKAMNEQNPEAVRQRVLEYAGASPEVTRWLADREQRLLKAGAAQWTREVLEEKVLGDCAVVVVNESAKDGKPAFDPDPGFLLRQNGQWRVFPKITVWDMSRYIPAEDQPASMKLTEQQRKQFTELSAWFDARKAALKAERKARLKPEPDADPPCSEFSYQAVRARPPQPPE